MPEGTEPNATEATVVTPETSQAQVPTTSEANPLEVQLRELQSQLVQKEESYKGLQKKVNQVNDELKKRGLSESRLETLEQTQRILVAMLAERDNISPDAIPTDKKSDYLKQFDEVIQKQKTKAQQEEFVAKAREYQARTETLGLDESSEEYLEVKDLVLEGKFDRAERKLAKLETQKVAKPEPVKAETPAEMEARLTKKILTERGLLNAETGQPAGGNTRSFTRQQIADMSIDEFAKNRADIEAARHAGRIK